MKEFLSHLLLPHHSNNHRAKALHIDALFIYFLFFSAFYISSRILHIQAPQILGYATDIYVNDLLAQTNSKRIANGLTPLSLNEQLSQAAAAKAQNMFSENYWSHTSPSGKTPWVFITGAGYKYSVAGENLAKNFSNSQGVVGAWMASSTHRDNLMKPSYHDVGFAVVNGVLNGEETTLVVQMFGSSTTGTVASKPIAVGTAQTTNQPQALVSSPTIQPVLSTPIPKIAAAVPTVILPTPPAEYAMQQQHYTVAPLTAVASAFSGATLKPMINLPVITRIIVYTFTLLMLLMLLVDGILAAKKRIIRVTGHTIAHMLFFSALFILFTSVMPGSIL